MSEHGAGLGFDPIAEARRQWVAHDLSEPTVMAAVTSVVRAHQLLIGRINALLAPFELTFARYEVLRLLSFSREGQLPLGKVGQRLQVHAASVTNAVSRLEAQGLVVRVPHPTDGRTRLARLTEQGRRVLEDATEVLTEARFAADGWTDEDARAVTDLVGRLRAAAGDMPAAAGDMPAAAGDMPAAAGDMPAAGDRRRR